MGAGRDDATLRPELNLFDHACSCGAAGKRGRLGNCEDSAVSWFMR